MAQAPAFIQTIVASTRIRLARNLHAYPFPSKLTPSLAKEVVFLVGKELDKFHTFEKFDMQTLGDERARVLLEQHLISPALTRRKRIHGCAFISADESLSVMVNEEDHLREQCIRKGFDLYKAYEMISGIDEGLSASLRFAYDKSLGYLTACPSNLGTGMRASVMTFLPGLAMTGELEKLIPTIKSAGLTVRGAFGEGTRAEGHTYQVSNERTLGVAESEILEQMTTMTMNLCDLEIRAREKLLKADSVRLRDKCLRAYGILTNCVLLTEEELAEHLTQIRLGLALGFFKTRDIHEFNDFVADMRPASFCVSNGLQNASEEQRNLVRAENLNKLLPERIKRKD